VKKREKYSKKVQYKGKMAFAGRGVGAGKPAERVHTRNAKSQERQCWKGPEFFFVLLNDFYFSIVYLNKF